MIDPNEIIDRRGSKKTKPVEVVVQEDEVLAEVLDPTPPLKPEVVIQPVETVYDNPVPIFDRILVLRMAKETVWAGTKIIVPDIAQKSPNRGVVVATAKHYIVDGKQFEMSELVKPGDLVTFSSFNVEDVTVDGETYGLTTIFDIKLIQSGSYAIRKVE